MALRSVIGKLRGSPAAEAVSRAFSRKCEKCGKTSSALASSLGQKNGAIKDNFEVEFRRYRRKHYIIRSAATAVAVAISWFTVAGSVAYLQDDDNFP